MSNKRELVAKIKLIEDFIALSLRREKIAETSHDIQKESVVVSNLLTQVHQVMRNELNKIDDEHDSVMRRMRQQQAIILNHVFNERTKKIANAEADEEGLKVLFNKNQTKNNYLMPPSAKKTPSHWSQFGPGTVTPKLSISEYKQSPLVRRTRIDPIPFMFLDFEYEITPKKFESIPKYMRGRETINELNNFLETVIIPCFNQKYQLLHRQRNTLRNRIDLDLWKVYTEQASHLPDRNFITAGDISRFLNKMIDKKTQNRITILRHIGVLHEQRVAQTIFYVWTANNNNV